MDRRGFLGAGAAATLTGMVADKALAATPNTPKGDSVKIDPQHIRSGLGKKIPVDRARATAVMEELGLDGIIALRPYNVYYLTNTITTLTDFADEVPALATLPRDPQQPSFLISSTGNTWETSNGDRDVPEIIAFSGASNWHDYVGATPEQMRIEPQSTAKNFRFGVRPDAALTPREAGWKRAQETYFVESAATREWALAHALKQSGLVKGKIAVDDMRIAYMLQSIGFDSVQIVPGENVFRKIRHIKSDYEIAMMRVAQQITRESVLAAARTLEEGMTYDEFKLRFFTEATARGGEPGFVLLGVTQGLLPDGVVKRGQSYLMDCSVHFNHYQGDFARTVTVGDPSAETLKRVKAQQAGREAAFEIIKAGVPFRKVEQVAKDAMLKAGMPPGLPVIGLHSVGLQHGDDPMRLDVPFPVRDDHILAENMTVTLDLPFIEIGGGAGHNEDLLRITKTGYELLNDPGEPLVVV